MIDPDDDRMIKGTDMDEIFDQELDKADRQEFYENQDAKILIPYIESPVGELPR